MSATLYCHTLRHLKPIQFYGRVWFRLYRPKPDDRPAPSLRKCIGDWQVPPAHAASMLTPSRFCFLNLEQELREPSDWNHPEWEKLWLYNLHYFDDLMRVDWRDWHEPHVALIQRWIGENSPGIGNGWEPYPLSLRIVNWIKWMIAGAIPPPSIFDSLAMQIRYLRRRLEMHLLGNHLFSNAKALVFAGVFFVGEEADAWLRKGIALLRKEIKEQILVDGAHFELSPMYHSIILEDVLDLINLGRTYPSIIPDDFLDDLRIAERRMRQWLTHLTHPDGDIAFFNDATFGIAASPAALDVYAMRLGGEIISASPEGLTLLPQSGYVRLQRENVTLLFDTARVGPDHLPGHAHADTLSFELSWGDQRVLCNSGTSCYGTGIQRHWERSTAAHNTVVIAATDSSEIWAGFRVARRAYPMDLASGERNGILFVSAAHDGYRRLPGQPIHWREVRVGNGVVTWTDRISSEQGHSIVGYLPLHPDIILEASQPSRWLLSLPNGERLELRRENGLPLHLEEGWYASEFGKLQRRSVLIWRTEDRLNVEERFSIRQE
ncbi:MAG: alginate lyase family protein [Pseudomonadota bacterium]